MKWWGWLVLGILLVAHQDYWLWNSKTLVAGFIPSGLAWHIGISVVAGLAWWAIVTWSWPTDIDVAEDNRERAPAPSKRMTKGSGP